MKTVKVIFTIGIGLVVLLMFVGKPSCNFFESFVKVIRNVIIAIAMTSILLIDIIINPISSPAR